MSEPDLDVLVVGAGPTGLALALQAHDHGARVGVVERRDRPFRPSRALIVHPRTLEVLRPLGVTDALLDRGDASPEIRLHLGRREIPVTLGDFAIADTAFPFLLLVAQAAVEDVLTAALAARGIDVRYGTELVDARSDGAGAAARLRGCDRDLTVTARYVAGCDGATSTVRRAAGIGWPGRPYRHEAVLADLELHGPLAASGASARAHAVAGPEGVLFLFPLGEQATWRLLVTRPATAPCQPPGQPAGPVPTRQLQALIDGAGLPARIAAVAWSAAVPLHHRLAARFRAGPLFLVGDAAHVHSPAGGQGMNTGVQDATNLGWKLAFAAAAAEEAGAAGAADRLLDTYQHERRPVARRTVALTTAIFWAEAGTDPLATFVRATAVPAAAPLVPAAMGRRRLVARAVRVLSQLTIRYRPGALCPHPGRLTFDGLRPGQRVPDRTVELAGGQRRLHEVLAGPGIHLLLQRSAPDPGAVPAAGAVRVSRILDWPGTAVVAVRPDGYVGCRDGSADLHRLRSWLAATALS